MHVSIIIPTYNVEEYIEECINSVFAQTYKNIEVICIDNNSTDNTWKRLEELKVKCPNLILDKEPKSGAPSARNKGLSLAKGEWIQFLDADDLLLPNKIEHQVTLVETTKCNLIYANYIRRAVKGKESKSNLNDGDLWLNLFNTSLGITSSNFWKKEILFELQGWDESLKSSQEYNLLFKYLKKTENIVLDKEHLTIIRERESGQISNINRGANLKRYIELRIEILKYLKSIEKDKDIFHQLLFDKIREYSKIDVNQSIDWYYKYYEKSFYPKNTTVNSRLYLILYKYLGFRIAEKLKRLQ